MTNIRIVDLTPNMSAECEAAARLLNIAFAQNWPGAWDTMEDARAEVAEMTVSHRIARVALDGDDVVGWIGGIPEYDGNVWELHPVVVDPQRQRQGIGARLVRDFEEQVRRRGGLTIQLGTDDENNMTSLSNVDLYVDLWEKIRNIQNFKGHPYSFYEKMGYVIIGVMPDANGRGKPDIIMGKRVE